MKEEDGEWKHDDQSNCWKVFKKLTETKCPVRVYTFLLEDYIMVQVLHLGAKSLAQYIKKNAGCECASQTKENADDLVLRADA